MILSYSFVFICDSSVMILIYDWGYLIECKIEGKGEDGAGSQYLVHVIT